MTEWKTILLGDICKTNTTSYSNKDAWEYVNYLDTGNITANRIDNIQYINLSDEKLPSRAKRKVKFNSIIYSTVRPNQCHYGIIKDYPDNFLVSTGFTVIDIDESIADADYIYCWLTQSAVTERLHSIAEQSTSAYPSIKPSDLEGLEIELPPLEVQRKASSILMSLDNKRDNNTRINRKLMEQAEAIYKSMFVSNVNSDWTLGKLSDLINVKYGKDHKKLGDGTIPVYGSGGIMRYIDSSLCENESVLIPRKGSLHNVMYVNEPFWSVDTMFYSEMKMPNIAKFIFHFLCNQDLVSMNAGSAVPSMTTAILNAMEIRIPSEVVLEEFEGVVSPMYIEIQENKRQSEKLMSLRDTLLPKLMSGELDLSDLEI